MKEGTYTREKNHIPDPTSQVKPHTYGREPVTNHPGVSDIKLEIKNIKNSHNNT